MNNAHSLLKLISHSKKALLFADVLLVKTTVQCIQRIKEHFLFVVGLRDDVM